MHKLTNFLRSTYLWILILPVILYFTGAASNQLVLFVNNDKFPVMLNESKIDSASPDKNGMIDELHCVMTPYTHLNALGDVFDFHDGEYSIGDLLLEFADWAWAFCPFVWGALVVKKLYGTG